MLPAAGQLSAHPVARCALSGSHTLRNLAPCSTADVPPTPGKEENDIAKVSSGSEQSDEEAGTQQVRVAMPLPLCLVCGGRSERLLRVLQR